MLELLLELILNFGGELLIQLFFEMLVEFGLQGLAEPFRRRPNPWLAAFGYVLLGGIAGALSFLIFPAVLIRGPAGRLANLILTPILAGSAMSALGAWRRGRGDELLRIDRFSYGFLFALAMALVRWGFCRPS